MFPVTVYLSTGERRFTVCKNACVGAPNWIQFSNYPMWYQIVGDVDSALIDFCFCSVNFDLTRTVREKSIYFEIFCQPHLMREEILDPTSDCL